MPRPGRIAAIAVAAAVFGAAPAGADDYCVGPDPGCMATLAAALSAARDHPGPDRVLLPEGDQEVPSGPADAPGEPVELLGRGAATRLTAAPGASVTLQLDEPASRATDLSVRPAGVAPTDTLVLAGTGSGVVVTAGDADGARAVRLLAGARLSGALVAGTVSAVPPARIERSAIAADAGTAVDVDAGDGTVVLEDSEIGLSAPAGAALAAKCATVLARHLTITGTAPRVGDLVCAEAAGAASLMLRDSVVSGSFADVVRVDAASTAASVSSAHAQDADVTATNRLDVTDPGFVSPTDHRLRSDSPLVDAGEADPLQAGEGFWDFGRLARVTDGNGDGVLRRDVGAHELQPPAFDPPAGNVLVNPGAEDGAPILTSGEGPEPPGWTRVGAFTEVGYGTAERSAQGADITLPTREAGLALGAGKAFFSAGPGGGATLVQRVDVSASAEQIDTGLASAALSGLLGGYGADEDEVRVSATFLDPAGSTLGTLVLEPVAPAERANDTNLLPRSAGGAIPARTRAIDVQIAGTRVSAAGSAETYADAYADNLALVLSVPGIAAPGPADPGEPPVKNLKPFAGVTVLTARPQLSRTGRARVGLACVSATVGACSGTLELRAQLRRGQGFSRVAQFARFRLAPGGSRTITLKLTLEARRLLRRAKSFRATLRAVVRDGQGLERRTTIPIRVRRR